MDSEGTAGGPPPDAGEGASARARALNTIGDGVVQVDAEGTVELVTERFLALTGFEREALLGRAVVDLLAGGDVEGVATAVETGLPRDDELRTFVDVATADGSVSCEIRLQTDEGDTQQSIVVFRERRDTTAGAGKTDQTIALERRVRQQQAVAELGQQALETTDLDELLQEAVTTVADRLDADFCKVLDLEPDGEGLLLRAGHGWRDGHVGETIVDVGDDSQAGYTLQTEEPVIVSDLDGDPRFSGPALLTDHGVVSGISTIIGTLESPWGILGVHDADRREFTVQDVDFIRSVAHVIATAIDRAAFERELERYRAVVETVDDGVYVLDEDSRFVLVNSAHEDLTGYSREQLVGSHASLVTSEEYVQQADEKQAMLSADDDPVVTLETALQRADGETIPVETRFSLFDLPDGSEGRVGIVRDITERKRRDRRLRQQSERLAALNNLNSVVRELTEELIAGSNREEIVQAVCDRLADSGSYEFAWIGEVDADQEVFVRAEAGVENYLDDLTLSIAADHPSASGPTVRAFRTQEMQVVRDVVDDPDYAAWRDHASSYGYRSSAAIPIAYDGSLHGVLNVYAARPDAFGGEEREVIGHLGPLIGHAITAVERKQALVSDEVVELVFEIQNLADTLEAELEGSEPVTFERVIATGEDAYLVYGTASEEGVAFLEGLCGQFDHWDGVTSLSTDAGQTRFELELTNPPAISVVADWNGRVSHATLGNDRYRMTAHIPPSADVRQVVEGLTDAYPEGNVVVQRRMTRTDADLHRLSEVFEEELTDRQRNTLETAYYGGFFNWPKDASGTDLADSLGISSPTFHQHLRAAERKLLAGLFEATDPDRTR